ncbi:hypothetical protein DSM101010T_32260 [Desulfovibrio subterraneus]|uniref:Uncharacterized protein n=1 Tax=Desulfovibrio subterraneus TaxID=2718620 RepID=A0A7J0BNL8_9BACT|nr:hypothetical protein DSM101010T_32260 [Desulfovibrio subterraneus]
MKRVTILRATRHRTKGPDNYVVLAVAEVDGEEVELVFFPKEARRQGGFRPLRASVVEPVTCFCGNVPLWLAEEANGLLGCFSAELMKRKLK